MSRDPLHQSEGAHDEWLQRAFREWDAGEPSVNVWEEVDASLSVGSVWERVGQSLTAEEHAQDQWIADAHRTWEPQRQTDGWAKLNDAISLEQVWRDLDHSLDQPVRTRIPVWKLAAACVASLFIVQQFNDAPIPPQTASTASAGKTLSRIIDSPVTPTPSVDIAQATPVEQDARNSSGNSRPNRIVVPQQPLPDVQRDRQQPHDQQLAANEQVNTAPAPDPDEDPQLLAQLGDQANDPLVKRSWEMRPGQVYPTDFEGHSPAFNYWTVQLGTQLSILEQRNQASLTSTLPHFALAADLSFRHRTGAVQFIHALGISQYSQGIGEYENGRHYQREQQINTLQLSTSVGYSCKRFTFYGGLLVSKVLSGLKQDAAMVKGVYDFNEVQTGLTGGIDYRLTTFRRSGNVLSVGSQYQWLPSVNGAAKTSFESIHALRFQAKFSF